MLSTTFTRQVRYTCPYAGFKLVLFCTAKKTISETKRQPSEWEKIFANKATDKGLISKIYKQLTQLNIKKKQTTQSKYGQKT